MAESSEMLNICNVKYFSTSDPLISMITHSLYKPFELENMF